MSSDDPKIKGYVYPYTIADAIASHQFLAGMEDESENDFAGLMTLCNTVPTEGAQLTYEDLRKAMEEFPTFAEESLQRHKDFVMNQNRWENMIICERNYGRTQRMYDMLFYMRLGANFDTYSKNVGDGFYHDFLVGPRFMRLRRRLYKAIQKL